MRILKQFHQYGLLIRWHRPIPILLLLWPTLTALFIAAKGNPPALLTFIFVTGVFVMRSAGCIINDMIDIKFDKHVARTKTRPLTAGTIQKWEALILLGILLLGALLLVLLLNRTCFLIACIGVLLTCVYPFFKRFFQLPQGVLGVVWNLGIIMAFAACNQLFSFAGWFLFIIAILWTIAFDTMYAMSDSADDKKLQLKSSAIWFGKQDRHIVCYLQLAIIVGLILLGLNIQANTWFYSAILAVSLTFIYQQLLINAREPSACLTAFNNNHWSWFFIFFGIFLNYH